MSTEKTSGSGAGEVGAEPAPNPAPAVPARVADKMLRLKSLETRLGHLPPDEISLHELHSRVSDPQFEAHAEQLEQQTEQLFREICDELSGAGFTADQTAQSINDKLRYDGGPKYCDAYEVRLALGVKGL